MPARLLHSVTVTNMAMIETVEVIADKFNMLTVSQTR